MKEILDEHLLEKAPPKYKNRILFFITLILLLMGSIISSVFSWYEIESIIGSGPIMSLVGIVYFLFARGIGNRKIVFIGLIPALISIFWLIMIFTFQLSPSDCKFKVPLSLSILTAFMWIIGIEIFISKIMENRSK